MTVILNVNNLRFSWGENEVLKGLNFNINNNELVAVLGVNGAGKSTLLKCINRILKPKSGSIILLQSELSQMELINISKLVSYVPQSVNSNFPMTVFDVVLLGRRPHINWKLGEKDLEIVSNTIDYLNLQPFAFRKFDQLSGGERQRVIIAKAIAQEPSLFLLDEPTSDLDLKNQIEIMKRLRELTSDNSTNRSALVAIHDINMAARFADKIILLHEGEIKQFGAPDEVLTVKNIEDVFSVTSQIVPATDNTPLRIIVNDEIANNNEKEE